MSEPMYSLDFRRMIVERIDEAQPPAGTDPGTPPELEAFNPGITFTASTVAAVRDDTP